ncbi:ATP-binding response regulator [Symmachiella dynata]|uniref:ATP-binding response regulator n=1 Tax=Symmachiella dynata TaxID=2527995 RepID=UPI0030EF6ECA
MSTAVSTKVLVVDDSEMDRRLAGGLLGKVEGWDILYAKDGGEALSSIAADLPDIVVTDLVMPGMTGLELIESIKDDHPLIPVVLMTGKGSEQIAAQVLKQGASSYVPKSRLAEDLRETVHHLLTAAREDRVHSRLMHYLAQSDSVFVLRNDLAQIRLLAGYFQQLLRCLPLGDQSERLRVGVAIEEALNNAYFHGNLEVGGTITEVDRRKYAELAQTRSFTHPYRDRKIYVRAEISREKATFVIRDEGPGFDFAQLLDAGDIVEQEQFRGRGIVLMRTIMDEVSYNECGNEVTIVKHRVAEDFDNDDGGDDDVDD